MELGYIFLSAAFLIVWGGTMYLWYSREADFRHDKLAARQREVELLKREDQLLNRIMSRDVQDYSLAEAYSRNYADMKDRKPPKVGRDMAGAFAAEQGAKSAE